MRHLDTILPRLEEARLTGKIGREYWLLSSLEEASRSNRLDKVLPLVQTDLDKYGFESRKHIHTITGYSTLAASQEPNAIRDTGLSRFAAFLTSRSFKTANLYQESESVKVMQAYFSRITKAQQEKEPEHTEDRKRVYIRTLIKAKNLQLAGALRRKLSAGCGLDYAEFHDSGYKGLNNGMGASEIYDSMKLHGDEHILDWMGSAELFANLLRMDIFQEKLAAQSVIRNKRDACGIHCDAGIRVRVLIEKAGGSMPEMLPRPKESIIEIEKKLRKIDKEKKKQQAKIDGEKV